MSVTLLGGGTSRSDFWELDGGRAVLHSGRLQGMIELSQPTRGLNAVRVDGAAQVGWLMGVDVGSAETRGTSKDQPWEIADVYVRGRDLVVTYREPLEQPFNLQLYWRIVDALDGAAALDLICSIQTPLWEARPGVTACSSMFETPAAIVDDALIAAGHGKWSYVEATRRGDFAPAAAERQGAFAGAYWRFGPQFMEKGVIRRLQVRGAFVPRDAATRDAGRLAQELAAEEPALTA
jgi:hypothetical protein